MSYTGYDDGPAMAPATAERHADELAALIEKVAVSVAEVSAYWSQHDLPGDFTTVEHGYPFTGSLDEVPGEMWTWAENLRAAYAV